MEAMARPNALEQFFVALLFFLFLLLPLLIFFDLILLEVCVVIVWNWPFVAKELVWLAITRPWNHFYSHSLVSCWSFSLGHHVPVAQGSKLSQDSHVTLSHRGNNYLRLMRIV